MGESSARRQTLHRQSNLVVPATHGAPSSGRDSDASSVATATNISEGSLYRSRFAYEWRETANSEHGRCQELSRIRPAIRQSAPDAYVDGGIGVADCVGKCSDAVDGAKRIETT